MDQQGDLIIKAFREELFRIMEWRLSAAIQKLYTTVNWETDKELIMEMNVVGRILNLFFRALRNWATSDIEGNDFFKFVTPIEVEMLVKFCFSKKYEILEKQKILLIDDEMEDSNNILFLKCILSNFDWTIKVNPK